MEAVSGSQSLEPCGQNYADARVEIEWYQEGYQIFERAVVSSRECHTTFDDKQAETSQPLLLEAAGPRLNDDAGRNFPFLRKLRTKSR